MYKFFNAHPKGLRVTDCVKRALTVATGEDYMEIQRQLNRLKRELGVEHYNDNVVWKKFISNKGWKEFTFQAVKGQKRMNGESFCESYPKGTYVLSMAGHLSVCKNGVIYDTWNCSQKCVYKAWLVG